MVWDAEFLEGFCWEVGEVVFLDNLIHMCLMLCTGKGSKDELQKSLSCWGEEYPWFVCPSEVKYGHRYVLAFRLSSDWKSCGGNKPDFHATWTSVSLFWDWQWERLTYFFSVGEALWNICSVDGSCSQWISFSFSSACLAQGPRVQQIRWMEEMSPLTVRLAL